MGTPGVDELRQLVSVATRAVVALERLAGIVHDDAPAPTTTPQRRVGNVAQRQGEPVRTAPPPMLASHAPPQEKRAPMCKHNGPVYIGATAIRCSQDVGHDGDHEHAGFSWPQDEPAAPNTEPQNLAPMGTETEGAL